MVPTRAPDTGIAYGAFSLLACYAMRGTGSECCAISRRACYAMCGTELAYGGSDSKGGSRQSHC
eukprot:3941267-Rhodomonas_salina.2